MGAVLPAAVVMGGRQTLQELHQSDTTEERRERMVRRIRVDRRDMVRRERAEDGERVGPPLRGPPTKASHDSRLDICTRVT
jgi:hypothetical protein